MSTCDAFARLSSWDENVNPPSYESSPIATRVQNWTPRFGYPTDISILLTSTEAQESQDEDYLRGLVMPVAAVATLFVLWCLILAVCKCIGPRRCGWLSGRGYATKGLRIAAFVACVCVLGGCVLTLSLGVGSFANSQDSTIDGLKQGQELVDESVALIGNVLDAQTTIQAEAEDFFQQAVNGFCPAIRSDVCTVSEDGGRSCNFDGLPYADLLQPLESVDTDVAYNDLVQGRQDLEELSGDLKDARNQIEDIQWPFYIAAALVGILAVLDLFLLWSLVSAWRSDDQGLSMHATTPRSFDDASSFGSGLEFQDNRHKRSRGAAPRCQRCNRIWKQWIMIPVFIVVTIICGSVSMMAAVGSIATSDLCYQDPDAHLMDVLQDQEENFSDSVTYDFLVYYVGGCTATQRPTEMQEKLATVSDRFTELSTYLTQVTDNTALVQETCGASPDPVQTASRRLLDELCVIATSLDAVQDLFGCENWHTIYRTVVYNAVCTQGSKGLHWLALSMVWIVLCAAVIVTVRVAFYETTHEDFYDIGGAADKSIQQDKGMESTDHDLTLREDHHHNDGIVPWSSFRQG